jgi:hypothetical protein
MTRQHVQFAFGFALLVVGAYVTMTPLETAAALGKPHDTSTQLINLRASWGGPLLGLGAFVAWLPALKPWPRTLLGLLAWAMVGIGAARGVGFILDGGPDRRQWLWMTLEVVIAIGCAIGLRVYLRKRSVKAPT